MSDLKISERPWYVSTGKIIDEKNNFVVGTNTKELAELILKLLNEYYEKENVYAL